MDSDIINNHTNEKRVRILQPKNDVVFQALFTRGKERITKALLEDILKVKIKKLDIDKSKELLNDNKFDKNGRVDLRAVLNDEVECDVEIQLRVHEKMAERFLFYWSKMYASSLKEGDFYTKLKKTISIIIVGERIKELEKIEKAHTKWQIREEENTQIILTDFLELHIIELPKALEEYYKNPSDQVLQWMMFLDNPEDVEVTKIMSENEDIKEAKNELDKISRDDLLRRMALKAEIMRMDQHEFEEEAKAKGLAEGLAEGREKGRKEGRKEGRTETKKSIAKNLLERGFSIEEIAQITELDIEEIKKIN